MDATRINKDIDNLPISQRPLIRILVIGVFAMTGYITANIISDKKSCEADKTRLRAIVERKQVMIDSILRAQEARLLKRDAQFDSIEFYLRTKNLK